MHGAETNNQRAKLTDEYKLSNVSLQSSLEVIKPVQGTMKVHAAIGLGNNSVMVRDVSCFCFKCFEGVKFCEESCCDGWEKHNLLKKQKKKGETNSDVSITPVASSSNKEGNAEVAKSSGEILTLTLETGEYVANYLHREYKRLHWEDRQSRRT